MKNKNFKINKAMKKLFNKSKFLSGGITAIVVTCGLISFSKSSQPKLNKQTAIKLRELAKISSANADGSVCCGDAGSPCTVTLNGKIIQNPGHKEGNCN